MSDLASYPHGYLPMPLQDGYGFKPVSPLQRTQATAGRARQRRKYTSTPTIATVNWIFPKHNQAQLFESWYRDVLTDGAAWFLMKLQTPLGCQQTYKCRFTDIYEGPTLVSPKYWRYSAQLELWERPLLPPGWGFFPDLVAGSDIIDFALNEEWPEA
ncbi:hypothetical protein OGY37_14595 [Citrobacter sp. Cpo030]|uniref:hypothetical protein n=1 Tax=Enterobacteriaceae TaxID=543 RepID=UPI0025762906|nr:hypothetical protein [Citrobacter sp. Cpo030]MDM2897249.1 hypothetical protein [Citrobacter sp. Cpo030]